MSIIRFTDSRFLAVVVLWVGILHVQQVNSTPEEEDFVRDSECVWSKNPQCEFKSNYQIEIRVVKQQHKEESFPRQLIQSARVAARVWLRAIRSTPASPNGRPVNNFAIPEECQLPQTTMEVAGRRNKNYTRTGNLIICLNITQNYDDERGDKVGYFSPASATSWELPSRFELLPSFVTVSINPNAAGLYNRCDWNNILLHEFGHAIGFVEDTFHLHSLYYHDDKHGVFASAPIFLGENTRREWIAMGGSASAFPELTSNDGSHWPSGCFNSPELMEPTFERVTPESSRTNSRVAISRLTFAVFQDLRYEMDMTCADQNITLQPSCSEGGQPPKGILKKRIPNKTLARLGRKVGRKARKIGRKARKILRKEFQTLNYRLGMFRVAFQKKCRRAGKRLKKKATKGIPHIKKKFRKAYRRVRRMVRSRIRGASPSLTLTS